VIALYIHLSGSRCHDNQSGTTSQGHPIDSKTSTLTVGPQGPVLLQDFTFIDEMAHFDRERISERVVHAKGASRSVRCWVIVWAIVWNLALWDIKIQKSPWCTCCLTVHQ